MTLVRESQVEDLVTVLSQRLNLHTRDTIEQTLELPVPRHGRCTKVDEELFKAAPGLDFFCETCENEYTPGCRGTSRGMRQQLQNSSLHKNSSLETASHCRQVRPALSTASWGRRKKISNTRLSGRTGRHSILTSCPIHTNHRLIGVLIQSKPP